MEKQSMKILRKTIWIIAVLMLATVAWADESPEDPEAENTKTSKWFGTPLISSDPKVSTSAGAMVGYMHAFDEASPPSIFAVAGTYSTTDSWIAGIFAKTHFGEDRHRVTAGAFGGLIRNDYSDFQGSGLPLQTTDDLTVYALRYVTRVYGHWYLGPQWISANYVISGSDALSGEIIETIGLTGFDSNGLGLLVQYDSRDNQYSPSSGQAFEAHNVAFREALGGDVSFDAYSADYQYYHSHGNGHVLALHAKGRWTHDAPPGGYSSVDLRGYTRGQYLAPHMTLAEVEERFALTKKWGLSAFTGLAVLYGGDRDTSEDQWFPNIGGGVRYKLNQEGLIVRAELAVGIDDNYGFYLQFGQPF